jgi:hypothetical protein
MTTIANEILIIISNTRWWSDSSLATYLDDDVGTVWFE